jgi:hypothetical protein
MEFLNKLTTKQKIFIGVAILLAIFGIIYVRKVLKERKEAKGDLGEPETIDTKAVDVTPNDSFPLKRGKRGKRVEQLQIWLLQNKGAQFPQFSIDGIWGAETEGNVKKFLNRDNISEDYWNKTNPPMSAIKTNIFK